MTQFNNHVYLLFISSDKDPKQQSVVPDNPATFATTVSSQSEAPKEKTKKASWWRRLFRCKKVWSAEMSDVSGKYALQSLSGCKN